MRHSMKHMKNIAELDPDVPQAVFPFAPTEQVNPPRPPPGSDEAPEDILCEKSDEETSLASDEPSPEQGKQQIFH